MQDFILIDLESQASAVAKIVENCTVEQFLLWLSGKGTLLHIDHPNDNRLYVYVSAIGIRTTFRLTTGNELVLILDHTTRPITTLRDR